MLLEQIKNSFLLIKTSIEGGAKIIGLPDTVGCCTKRYEILLKIFVKNLNLKKFNYISALS